MGYSLLPLGLNTSFALQYPNPERVIVESSPSNEASAIASLPNPTGLVITGVSTTGVQLQWNQYASNADTILVIERKDNLEYVTVDTVASTVTSYTDGVVTAYASYNQCYVYRIRAVKGEANSLASNEVAFTTGVPTNLSSYYMFPGAIRLAWQDRSATEERFIIESSSGGSVQTLTVGANTTIFIIPVDPNKTFYSLRIRAENNSEQSQWSNTTTLTIPKTRLPPRNGVGI